MAVVDSFKHWRRYLKGATHQLQVYSDHQNLEYFTTTKVLNRQQARWPQELAGVDFKIYYRPGAKNGKPDAVSRRSEYHPEKGGSESQPITTVLHKTHFAGAVNTLREGTTTFIISAAQLSSLPVRSWKKEFLALVRSAGEKDLEYCKALEELKAKENGEVTWAGPVLDGPEAKENEGNEEKEEAARAGSVPNGRMAKDRKTAQAGKGIIEMKNRCVYRKGML